MPTDDDAEALAAALRREQELEGCPVRGVRCRLAQGCYCYQRAWRGLAVQTAPVFVEGDHA